MHAAFLILAMAAATILLRFLPFLIFRDGSRKPAVITYLGHVLPPAAIGMLVIYCLRNVNVGTHPYGIPEGAACILVAILQRQFHNTILSILAGTGLYMLLIQNIFA